MKIAGRRPVNGGTNPPFPRRPAAAAVLGALFAALLSGAPASAGPVSHGPRHTGEEVLDELVAGRETVVARVASNGCTGKGSFRIDVRKEEGFAPAVPHYVLTIVRTAPDECKAIVGGGDGPAILWDLGPDLGLSGNYTFSVSNRVRSATPPSEWGDRESSPVAIVREHVRPEGGSPGEAPPEGAPPGGPGAGGKAPSAAPAAPAEGAPPDPADYRGLVSRLEAGDLSVDFTALRMSYAETEEYMPYGGDGREAKEMLAALRERDFAKAVKRCESALKGNYADPELHRLCALAHERFGNREKGAFHASVAKGLSRSIRASGDGSSPDKAFRVISTTEEDFLLLEDELQALDGKTVEIDGHLYDRVEANPLFLKILQPRPVWFNVDVPQRWLKKGPREAESRNGEDMRNGAETRNDAVSGARPETEDDAEDDPDAEEEGW